MSQGSNTGSFADFHKEIDDEGDNEGDEVCKVNEQDEVEVTAALVASTDTDPDSEADSAES